MFQKYSATYTVTYTSSIEWESSVIIAHQLWRSAWSSSSPPHENQSDDVRPKSMALQHEYNTPITHLQIGANRLDDSVLTQHVGLECLVLNQVQSEKRAVWVIGVMVVGSDVEPHILIVSIFSPKSPETCTQTHKHSRRCASSGACMCVPPFNYNQVIISIHKEPLPLGCGRGVQPVWCCREKVIVPEVLMKATTNRHTLQHPGNNVLKNGGWRTKFATVPPRKTTTDEADRVEHAARTETGASAFNPDRRRCAIAVNAKKSLRCRYRTEQNAGTSPNSTIFSEQTNKPSFPTFRSLKKHAQTTTSSDPLHVNALS